MNFQQRRIIHESASCNYDLTDVASMLFTSQSGDADVGIASEKLMTEKQLAAFPYPITTGITRCWCQKIMS